MNNEKKKTTSIYQDALAAFAGIEAAIAVWMVTLL